MLHLDRELHKLAIALDCEKDGTAVALICAGSSKFVVARMTAKGALGYMIATGATGAEAMQLATNRVRAQADSNYPALCHCGNLVADHLTHERIACTSWRGRMREHG